jgi:hypothetical protein
MYDIYMYSVSGTVSSPLHVLYVHSCGEPIVLVNLTDKRSQCQFESWYNTLWLNDMSYLQYNNKLCAIEVCFTRII